MRRARATPGGSAPAAETLGSRAAAVARFRASREGTPSSEGAPVGATGEPVSNALAKARRQRQAFWREQGRESREAAASAGINAAKRAVKDCAREDEAREGSATQDVTEVGQPTAADVTDVAAPAEGASEEATPAKQHPQGREQPSPQRREDVSPAAGPFAPRSAKPSPTASALVALARTNPEVHAALTSVSRDPRTGQVDSKSLAKVTSALKGSAAAKEAEGQSVAGKGGLSGALPARAARGARRAVRFPTSTGSLKGGHAATGSPVAPGADPTLEAVAALSGARRAVDEWVSRGGRALPVEDREAFAKSVREQWAARVDGAPPSVAGAKAKAEIAALVTRVVLGCAQPVANATQLDDVDSPAVTQAQKSSESLPAASASLATSLESASPSSTITGFVPGKLNAGDASLGGGCVPPAFAANAEQSPHTSADGVAQVSSPATTSAGTGRAATAAAGPLADAAEALLHASVELIDAREHSDEQLLLEASTGIMYTAADVPLPVGKLVRGAVVRPAGDVCVRAEALGTDALENALAPPGGLSTPAVAAAAVIGAMGEHAQSGDEAALTVAFALAARSAATATLSTEAALRAIKAGAEAARAPVGALMHVLAQVKAALQARTRQPLRALSLAFRQFGAASADGSLSHLEAVALVGVLLPNLREAPLEGGPAGQDVLLAHIRATEAACAAGAEQDQLSRPRGRVTLEQLARMLRLVPIVRPRPTRPRPRMFKWELPGRKPQPKRDGSKDAGFWDALEHKILETNSNLTIEFAKFDKDRSGSLEWPELRRFIRSVMPGLSGGDLRYFRGALGLTHKGDSATFSEVCANVKAMRAAATNVRNGGNVDGSDDLAAVFRGLAEAIERDRTTVQTEFRAFDRDGSGFLEPFELRAMFLRLAPEMTVRDVRLVLANMQAVDRNSDGKISLKELKAAFARFAEPKAPSKSDRKSQEQPPNARDRASSTTTKAKAKQAVKSRGKRGTRGASDEQQAQRTREEPTQPVVSIPVSIDGKPVLQEREHAQEAAQPGQAPTQQAQEVAASAPSPALPAGDDAAGSFTRPALSPLGPEWTVHDPEPSPMQDTVPPSGPSTSITSAVQRRFDEAMAEANTDSARPASEGHASASEFQNLKSQVAQLRTREDAALAALQNARAESEEARSAASRAVAIAEAQKTAATNAATVAEATLAAVEHDLVEMNETVGLLQAQLDGEVQASAAARERQMAAEADAARLRQRLKQVETELATTVAEVGTLRQ